MTDTLERLRAALADRYAIERELGAGGMATVYLAEDLKHHRKVAVKVLRPELAAVLGAERFLQEITTTANLQHPHILPLFDSGEARVPPLRDTERGIGGEAFLYYVMPFIEGESLREKLTREKQFAVEEAIEITRAVAGALDYAHRRQVIHRDIKPENILLHDGQPMVTDFGIALAVSAAAGSRITETGLSLGTPHYMSPEQTTADRELTGRSDIYALGCLAYEMLVGDPPHTGSTVQAIVAKILTEEPRRLSAARKTVPAHVDAAIHRALQKLPADRFASAAEFATALGAPAVAPETHSVTADGGQPVSSRWSRRRVGIGAVVVAAIATGAWWMNLRSGPTAPATSVPADTIPSVAVLPFTDPGATNDDQYFGDGVAETLIYALGKVPGLRVAAQTSAFTFRGDDVDLGTVGDRLNVETVLRGNVQRARDRLRVTVRLESTADGAQLWTGQYDEQAADVFAVQDAIARAVVDELQVRLLGPADEPIVQPGTENLEAYNLYLQGRYAVAQRGDGLLRALEFFQRAVELDPFYAQAHAGMADAYALSGFWSYRDPTETIPKARAAAELALSLDPSLAAPHATLGWIATFVDWDESAAEGQFRQAIALDSNYVEAHHWYGRSMASLRGDTALGVSEVERAVELDPLSPFLASELGLTYSEARRHDEAIEAGRRAVQLLPSWVNYLQLSIIYRRAGRLLAAVAAADSAVAVSEGNPMPRLALGWAYTATDDTARVRAIRDDVVRLSGSRYVHPAGIASLQMWLGEEAEAELWLERAFAERDPLLFAVVSSMHWGYAAMGTRPEVEVLWSRMVGQ